MKRFIQIGVVLLALSATLIATAGVIHFDDITTDTMISDLAIPLTYSGFNWQTGFTITSQSWLTTGYWGNTYIVPSGLFVAYNADGFVPLTITSATAFTFNGAQFASYGAGDRYSSLGTSAETIIITGYRSGLKVGSVEGELSPENFAWLGANFTDIDTLVFSATGSNEEVAAKYWLMDNFTYNEPVITPEPLTATLLGISLLGLAGLRRRLS
jgi:hypothetical protein